MKAVNAIFAVVFVLSFATAASAGQRFFPYEGSDAIQTGTGGAKTTENGIDFWAAGTPPRKYKIIGIMEDKRENGAFLPDVIGSKGVAKLTLKYGGDAVIVMESSYPIGKKFTKLAVIKYEQ